MIMLRPCELAGYMAKAKGQHPSLVQQYLLSKLPLGRNYISPYVAMDLLKEYGVTLEAGYFLGDGYLHI